MGKLFTIQEVEKRHLDMVKGQVWKGSMKKYKYICGEHGVYEQSYRGHSQGQKCFKCAYNKHRTANGLSHDPEYMTVKSHFTFIFNPNHKGHKNYKGMPFFDNWNPNKGGSWLAGMSWIIKNLGKKPKGASLHIIEQEKGFIPGNLEWTHPKKQVASQMFKIIAGLKHRIKDLESKLEQKELA